MIVKFFKQQKGSLTIEAAIIFGFLVILAILVSDISSALLTKSKLNVTSYSLASLIRQRELYDTDEVNKNDVENLYKVAQRMTKSFIPNKILAMQVEIMYFDEKSTREKQTIKGPEVFNVGSFKCVPEKKISSFKHLAIFSMQGEWTPMLQVTLCTKIKSNFIPTKNFATYIIDLSASNIAYIREKI